MNNVVGAIFGLFLGIMIYDAGREQGWREATGYESRTHLVDFIKSNPIESLASPWVEPYV